LLADTFIVANLDCGSVFVSTATVMMPELSDAVAQSSLLETVKVTPLFAVTVAVCSPPSSVAAGKFISVGSMVRKLTM
jgi:hypothetical protein